MEVDEMERIFVELAGVIDEVETAFGELGVKSFSNLLSEWIRAKVSKELDREVEESELIMAFLVLAAKRDMSEVEEGLSSDLRNLFEVLKKIEVFRF